MFVTRPSQPIYTVGVSQEEMEVWQNQFLNLIDQCIKKGYLYTEILYFVYDKDNKRYLNQFKLALDDLNEFKDDLLNGATNENGTYIGINQLGEDIQATEDAIQSLLKEQKNLLKCLQIKEIELAAAQAAIRRFNSKGFLEPIALLEQHANSFSGFLQRLMPTDYINNVKEKYKDEKDVQLILITLNNECKQLKNKSLEKQAELVDQQASLEQLQMLRDAAIGKLKEVYQFYAMIEDIFCKMNKLNTMIKMDECSQKLRHGEKQTQEVEEIFSPAEVHDEKGEYAAFAPTFSLV